MSSDDPRHQPPHDPEQPVQWGPPQQGQWGPPPPPPGGEQWQPSNPVPPARQQNWFARHKVLSAVLGVVVLVVIVSALGGGGGSTTTATDAGDPGGTTGGSGSTAQEQTSDHGGAAGESAATGGSDGLTSEQANDTPSPVQEGKAFVHDAYAVAPGWTVVRARFGGVSIEGLTVTNKADTARTAMDCFSTSSSFPEGYEEILVADMF